MVFRLLCFASLIILSYAIGAGAAPLTYDATRIETQINGLPVGLEAFIAKPAISGRLPVVLITHGSNNTPEKLDASDELGNWALDFAARGYLAVAVLRQGYGKSDGTVNQSGGTCEAPTPALVLQRDADDLEGALKAIALRPDADMSRVVAIGQSRGGSAVTALSARSSVHLSAVISVSGGVYHLDKGAQPRPFHVYDNCERYRDALIETVSVYARTAHMPQLWAYEENDPWFSPDLVQAFRQGWEKSGGNVQVAILPPSDINGHQLFFSAQGRASLHPLVDDFLRRNNLPTWSKTNTATLRATLRSDQQKDLDAYLEGGTAERALAIAKDGSGRLHYNEGRAISDRARRDALKTCEDQEHKSCKLLMANFDLLPQTVSHDKSEGPE
ncbi:alpha/beta hydrolase family protein [Agrobacterium vaccinii]|uniref:alpha/beta hydrolase family protein n=1 Tax=Agrobacterium vaccinii TaxID=2735528 RepID=UPI001E4D6FDC|nr:CocE/NonD family hydrolase [Agrobacterium vaccinii]UHS55788.1 hypothetical protein HRS00_02645 [Agrobacterium vaccinii]